MDQRRAETGHTYRGACEGVEQSATTAIGGSAICGHQGGASNAKQSIGGSVPSARNQLDASLLLPSNLKWNLVSLLEVVSTRRNPEALCKNDAERQEVRNRFQQRRGVCAVAFAARFLWHQPHNLEDG